jgi:hypothetical protein
MGYKQGDTYYYNQMPKMVPAPTVPIAAVVEEPVTTPLAVSTYPNPFRDVVRFEIRSATGGQGELSIYDMQGTRVSTFAVGKVPAGQVFRFEYRMPATPMQTLMYRITVGNRQVTGKLMRSGN